MTAVAQLRRPHVEDRSEDDTSLQLQFERVSTGAAVAAAENDSYVQVSTDKAKESKLQVPVVDISGLAGGDGATRRMIVNEITLACETWGIFQIVNHGVPQRIFKELDKQARDFFALPLEVKERVNLPFTENYQQQGFLRKLQTDPLHSSWRENLAYASTWSETTAMINDVWPNGNAPLMESLLEYFKAVEELGLNLLEILAEGLGLKSNSFSKHLRSDFDEKCFRWRVNFYPPRPEPKLSVGLTAHSDPNLLSLLTQDEIRGLQARKDGQWVDVTPISGALVVNVGDSLEAWTNGRFNSVVHRVVVNHTQARLSWIFLLTTPSSVLIQAPPELIDEEHPQLFKPFTYDDIANNLYQKVGSARRAKDSQKLLPKRIFYDYALFRP